MKLRFISIAIAAAGLIAFSGCGNSSETVNESSTDTVVETKQTSETTKERVTSETIETETIREEVTYDLNRIDSISGISYLISDKWVSENEDDSAYYYCYDKNGDVAGMIGVLFVGNYPGSSKSDQLETISKIVSDENTELENIGARNIKKDTAFLTSKQWAARIDYTIYNENVGMDFDVTGYTFFVGESAYTFIYYDKSGINDIFHCSVDMIESITITD